MNPDGSFGLKIQNLFARFGSYGDEIRVAEGTGWPDLSWEIQQTFFTERGMDLVVDPPAPAPERHVRAKFQTVSPRSGSTFSVSKGVSPILT